MTPESRITPGEKEKFVNKTFPEIRISSHAIKRFYLRLGWKLKDANGKLDDVFIEAVRQRLSEAKPITTDKNPFKQLKNHFYFRDSIDQDLIFVLLRDPIENDKYILRTVFRLIKR